MPQRITVKQLTDHIWLMDENHQASGYLVVGTEKALVIDTMYGYEDLHALIASITDKPLTVVNTHGHWDHFGGNLWLDEAFLKKEDLPLVEHYSATSAFRTLCKTTGRKLPPFRDIHEGDVIDLGGLSAEIFELPGHTLGGICILLREDRILFTGDSINRHLWMQLEESLPLQQTLQNLDRLAFLTERADRILHGHASDFEDISLFFKLREGIRLLCEQKGSEISDGDLEYDWFGGKALQHEFDRDSVIVYTRSKLNRIPMNPEFEKIGSYCGIDCSDCDFKKKGQCGGCVASGGRPFHMNEGQTCKLAACCRSKGLRYCADCAEIPCDTLKQFSFDPKHGDHPQGARIERLGLLKKELLTKARRGLKQYAVCGFPCGESCFLGERCGGCGSEYNCCSYATVMPDGICPNLRCVKEKGFEGCWDCPELESCRIGFYGNDSEPGAVNLAKAGAMYIRRFGPTWFVAMLYHIQTEKKLPYNEYLSDQSSPEIILENMIKAFTKQ